MKPTLDLRRLDEWYALHFEELVEKYPKKALAIVNEQIVAVGDSEEAVDREAREKHPGETPFVITVPSEEELVCLVYLKNLDIQLGEERVNLPVGFSARLGVGFSLLGRTGLFNRFKVCFDESNGLVTFERHR